MRPAQLIVCICPQLDSIRPGESGRRELSFELRFRLGRPAEPDARRKSQTSGGTKNANAAALQVARLEIDLG